ncbi:hypothetical protein HMPREF2531_04019 [Bacteroides intestinalis]|uniref:DUF1919 domain-containing protein n=2 Tax=Bacteroides intestinalis TaxID=329854 RepID=A0A139KYA1_9BACE|nr:hypothetical protein HMPREF2531_04019 [Bacteroides intestinalis]
MNVMAGLKNKLKVSIREKMNPYLAPYRLQRLELMNRTFTIISNNCWGGHVYRYFGLSYNSPTIGLFFFAQDYIKFVENLPFYINKELSFISLEESHYCDKLREYGGECINCPIGRLADIEIIFMHYKTENEAAAKWQRRVQRINWNNLILKMSEQNGSTINDLKAFDALPYKKKVLFVTRDYGLKSQVIFKEFMNRGNIPDDTSNFKRYVNLVDLINGK